MHPADKWVTIRVTVDQAREIQRAIDQQYFRKFNAGFAAKTKFLLKIKLTLYNLLEVKK